jgi:hypothetical protein
MIHVVIAQYPQMDFPLHVGDLWQYQEPGPEGMSYETKVVGDTLMPNGLRYFKGNGYLRKNSSKVYRYNPFYQNEEVQYDFSKKVGDTIAIYYGTTDTGIVTVTDDGMKNIFGSWRRYMTFYERGRRTSFYHIRVITDSIGLTFEQFEPGVQFYLSGAIINGNKYGTITSAKDKLVGTLAKYTLCQNFPNPFNPSTKIQYSIPKDGFVTLRVFDLLGKEVATLVSEKQSAGIHVVEFNGSHFPSGIYFYRLQTDKFVETQKFVLLR